MATKKIEITKKKTQYRIIGKAFREKQEAVKELADIRKKGFKSAGLMVRGNNFVILFGTYPTEQIAEKGVAVIKKMGIAAEVER